MTKLTKKQQSINLYISKQTMKLIHQHISDFVEKYDGGEDYEYYCSLDLKNTTLTTHIENLDDIHKKFKLGEIATLMITNYLTDDETDWEVFQYLTKGFIWKIGKCDDCNKIHCNFEYKNPNPKEEEPTQESIVEDTTNPQE